MQSQLERMAKLNADYRRKTTLTQQRAQNLIQEKADLQVSFSYQKSFSRSTVKPFIYMTYMGIKFSIFEG